MGKKVNIKVVILSTAVSYTGGAIISLLDVMPLLQKRGIQPYFILKKHGTLENKLEKMNIPYRVIKSYDWCVPPVKKYGFKNRVSWVVKFLINLIAEIRTANLLKKENADVFHLNCIYNGTGAYAAKYLGIPIVWHLREFVNIPEDTTVFVNSKRAWKVINFSDNIICVSKYLRKYYKPYIADQTKIRVVYDGINLEKYSIKNKNFKTIDIDDPPTKSKIIIGMSGTAPIKGHEDAIRAVALLKQRGIENVVLRIAGHWSKDDYNAFYYRSLQKLIEQHDLEINIEFLGMLDDMNTFWRQSDVAIICSRYESFGLAAVEAMICGVPLVCSNTSISGELTDDSKNVFTYQTGNYRQLSEVIEECLRQIGMKSINIKLKNTENFVRDNFSVEKSAEAFFSVLSQRFR